MDPVDEQNIDSRENKPTKKLEDEPTKKLEDKPTQKLEDKPTQKLEDKPIKNLKRVEQGKRLAEWNKANKQRLLQKKNIDTPPQTNVSKYASKNVLIAVILIGLVGAGLFYRTTDVEPEVKPEVKPKKINVHKKDDLFEM